MVVSMLLERTYDLSFWLRLLYFIIAIIGIAGLADCSPVTVVFIIYCVLQRTVLSVMDEFIPDFPQLLFTVGLIIEIVFAIIVIIIESQDGSLCLLREVSFLYENWFISSCLSRFTYVCITTITSEIIIIFLIIIFLIVVAT